MAQLRYGRTCDRKQDGGYREGLNPTVTVVAEEGAGRADVDAGLLERNATQAEEENFVSFGKHLLSHGTAESRQPMMEQSLSSTTVS